MGSYSGNRDNSVTRQQITRDVLAGQGETTTITADVSGVNVQLVNTYSLVQINPLSPPASINGHTLVSGSSVAMPNGLYTYDGTNLNLQSSSGFYRSEQGKTLFYSDGVYMREISTPRKLFQIPTNQDRTTYFTEGSKAFFTDPLNSAKLIYTYNGANWIQEGYGYYRHTAQDIDGATQTGLQFFGYNGKNYSIKFQAKFSSTIPTGTTNLTLTFSGSGVIEGMVGVSSNMPTSPFSGAGYVKNNRLNYKTDPIGLQMNTPNDLDSFIEGWMYFECNGDGRIGIDVDGFAQLLWGYIEWKEV